MLALHITSRHLFVDVFHELACIHFGHREVDDALYAERQAKNQHQRHERHEAYVSIHEFGLQLLVKSVVLSFGHDVVDHEFRAVGLY